MMNEKSALLKRVQICDFTLDEVGLFLDTHPEDQAALAYYKKHQMLKKEAMEQYQMKYGPLTAEDYCYNDRWTWIDNPWPWEREV
jgi:spore coat protein JB